MTELLHKWTSRGEELWVGVGEAKFPSAFGTRIAMPVDNEASACPLSATAETPQEDTEIG